MATLTQYLKLQDGVSGPLKKMASAATTLMHRQDAAADAIARTERASNGMAQKSGRAVSALYKMADGLGAVSSAAYRAENSVNNMMNKMGKPSGGGFFSSTIGQFAVGNIIGDMVMRGAEAALDKVTGMVAKADMYSGMQARLELVTGSQQDAVDLNNQIYASALRARGSYETMADSVSKIGLTAKEAFPDPRELVPFVENIQKLFTIGGTDAESQKNAMLQLTQALGSGRLQGDELRSIAEAAPMIEQVIAEYMGVSMGEIKQLGAEGKITADIIKNAMLGATDEINAKFDQIPLKWQDIWTNIATRGDRALMPVYTAISDMANSDAAMAFADNAVMAVQVFSAAVLGIINNAEYLYGIFDKYDNFIVPVLFMLAAAMAATKLQTVLATGAAGAHTVASWAETTALIALTFAQEGATAGFTALNTAMGLSPVTWMALAVIALVGTFYLAVAAVNEFAGANISATGLIAAGFMAMGAIIYNVFASQWNFILSFAEFLGNVFVDPVTATYNLFANIWNGIVDLVGVAVENIIGMIAEIPGISKVVDIDTNFRAADYKMDLKQIDGGLDLSGYRAGLLDVGNEADWAYNAAANWSFGDMLPELPGVDPVSGAGELSGIKDGIDNVTGNTKAIKDAMDIVDEDLKFYRDMAEQEVINRYTTARVDIKVENQNNIASDVDADGMITHLIDQLGEAMDAGGEAVHNAL